MPILKAPFLKVFSLFKNQSSEEENKESTDLEDIENLTKWDCPCLESINIDNNKITKLPKLNFPLLNTFSFVGNPISNYK